MSRVGKPIALRAADDGVVPEVRDVCWGVSHSDGVRWILDLPLSRRLDAVGFEERGTVLSIRRRPVSTKAKGDEAERRPRTWPPSRVPPACT